VSESPEITKAPHCGAFVIRPLAKEAAGDILLIWMLGPTSILAMTVDSWELTGVCTGCPATRIDDRLDLEQEGGAIPRRRTTDELEVAGG
jgi:hypothetical protein